MKEIRKTCKIHGDYINSPDCPFCKIDELNKQYKDRCFNAVQDTIKVSRDTDKELHEIFLWVIEQHFPEWTTWLNKPGPH